MSLFYAGMIARLLLSMILCGLAVSPAAAQDYAREQRWADEVVPGLVVGDAAWLETSAGRKFLALYAPATKPKGALVIVHGIGVHPDHGLIGLLRTKLTDLGWTTLSIQMPVAAADARPEAYFPDLFPEAKDRIARAGAWLAAKQPGPLAIVSHSMGAWMTNAYFDDVASSPYRAWVGIGITGGYSLATWFSPRPILDVYGEEDHPNAIGAAWRRRITVATAAEGSRQVMMRGANHFHHGREDALAREIDAWLAAVPANGRR